MDPVEPFGSPKGSISFNDTLPVIRDAAMIVISAALTFFGDKYIEGGLTPELKVAATTLIYAGFKLAWKYFTDTSRTSMV